MKGGHWQPSRDRDRVRPLYDDVAWSGSQLDGAEAQAARFAASNWQRAASVSRSPSIGTTMLKCGMSRSASTFLYRVLLSLALGIGVGCKEPGTPEEIERRAVLHEAVVAVNESWLSGAVSRHGRIRPDEIPYLIDQTASWYQQRRQNATKLLIRANLPQATAHLRKLILATKEYEIWLLALGALLDEPDAPLLAAARQQFLDKALDGDDDVAVKTGFIAAILIGQPGIYARAERMLEAEEDYKRHGVQNALARVGPGPLLPMLVERAVRDAKLEKRPESLSLYGALLFSSDPRLAPIFRNELIHMGFYERAMFQDWLQQPKRRPPWLRTLLLQWVQLPSKLWLHELRQRWSQEQGGLGFIGRSVPEAKLKVEAVSLLKLWGPEVEPALLQGCIEAYEAIPEHDPTFERKRFLDQLEACRHWLGELAGPPMFTSEPAEFGRALDFARKRLAGTKSDTAAR